MQWESEKIHQNPGSLYDALLSSIRGAECSIDFETFIFDRDSLGEAFLDGLVQAVKRGCRVRLIVDGVGSPQFDENFIRELYEKGLRVRVYRPWKHFLKRIVRLFMTGRWFEIIPEFTLMNRRDHRKTCIIDGRVAWIGSANVSRRHSTWRETVAEIRGEDILLIQKGFEWVWGLCRSTHLPIPNRGYPKSSEKVQHSFGFETRRKKERFRRNLIRNSKKRIRLVSPYFVPPFPLLFVLLRALQRGVRVDIMLPVKSDFRMVQWISRTYYSILLKFGADIYEYKPSMIHSKILIVDDQAIIGSSNYDFRSFLHDLEIDILLNHLETIDSLDQQWSIDLLHSERIHVSMLPHHGRFRSLKLRFIAFFKRHL